MFKAEFPGMSLEKFPRKFPGILLRSGFYFYIPILNFDKCSYSARYNVKVMLIQLKF